MDRWMEGWINRLAVDPEFRGRGLAKRLISEVEGRLRARGRRIIAVLVEGWNEPALPQALPELWLSLEPGDPLPEQAG